MHRLTHRRTHTHTLTRTQWISPWRVIISTYRIGSKRQLPRTYIGVGHGGEWIVVVVVEMGPPGFIGTRKRRSFVPRRGGGLTTGTCGDYVS